MTATPQKSRDKTRRTRLGCVCKLLCGVVLLLLSAAGGVYTWLNCWKWQSLPEFHESWTPEERAALIQFDTYLTDGGIEKDSAQAQQDFSVGISHLTESLTGYTPDTFTNIRIRLEQIAATLYMSHAFGKPMRRELSEIVKSGSAARAPLLLMPCTTLHDTPARLALYTGHTEAAKALVKHGADTNFYCEKSKESLLSCLLSNKSLRGTHPLPLKKGYPLPIGW